MCRSTEFFNRRGRREAALNFKQKPHQNSKAVGGVLGRSNWLSGESPHLVSPSCVEKGLSSRFHEQSRQKVLNLSGASAVYRVVF
jgi:hypothetical protein